LHHTAALPDAQVDVIAGGIAVGYAWGMGVRSHGGYRVYRHGGGWPGLRAAGPMDPSA
jgi:hypothetical protein